MNEEVVRYRSLLTRSESANAVNQHRIGLENTMTPADLVALARAFAPRRLAMQDWWAKQWDSLRKRLGVGHFSERARADTHQWIERMMPAYHAAGKDRPEPFVRRQQLPNVQWYETNGGRRMDQLLVCFAGNSERLMMPIPVFLQHCDSSRMDVVVVRDPSRTGYRKGVANVAETLDDALERLPELLGLSRYGRLMVVGTSGGGAPAAIAAIRWAAAAVVAVGGNHPDDPRWLRMTGSTLAERLERAMEWAGTEARNRPAMHWVYGRACERDRLAAEAAADRCGGRLIPVETPDGANPHNALFPVAQRGELWPLLREALLGDGLASKVS